MRIIEEKLEEMIHKCKYCGSTFSYTAKDVDYFWTPTMRCPVCKATNSPSMFDRKVK